MVQLSIAVIAASFAKDPDLRLALAAVPGVHALYPSLPPGYNSSFFLQAVKKLDVDALLVGTELIDSGLLAACPRLKALFKYGVGCDNIDIAGLAARGIYFGWTPGTNRQAVAELVIGFAIGHSRNLFRCMSLMSQGQWHKNGGRELAGQTLGIVGLGAVGGATAVLGAKLGLEILYTDIADRSVEAAALGAQFCPWPEILGASDIVSLHVPLTAATANVYNEAAIAQTRPGSLVINTARGGVVDFQAVTAAVRSGRLGGYAADVFTPEPFDAQGFRAEDGFYFTPHIGGNSRQAVQASGLATIEHVKLWLRQAAQS